MHGVFASAAIVCTRVITLVISDARRIANSDDIIMRAAIEANSAIYLHNGALNCLE